MLSSFLLALNSFILKDTAPSERSKSVISKVSPKRLASLLKYSPMSLSSLTPERPLIVTVGISFSLKFLSQKRFFSVPSTVSAIIKE